MTSTKSEVVPLSRDIIYIDFKTLKNFIRDIFVGLNVSKADSEIIADVLITSDLRGIDSHGIQRLKMYYDRIKKGIYCRTRKVKNGNSD